MFDKKVKSKHKIRMLKLELCIEFIHTLISSHLNLRAAGSCLRLFGLLFRRFVLN